MTFSEKIGIDVVLAVCFSNAENIFDYAQVSYTWNKSGASAAYGDGVTIVVKGDAEVGPVKTINLNTMKAEKECVK